MIQPCFGEYAIRERIMVLRMKRILHSEKFRSLLILWGLIAISCLVIFRPFLFGDKLVVFNDAGSDTRQQYLMQYATIVNHLRSGNLSLWDLNNGFGASMFSLNMSNIFLMLVYLAGFLFGVGRIPGVIVYLLILQIFLAGTFCRLFLDCFSFSGRSKTIASYIYALNGYILVWGQHYQFGSFVVFLPLLLLLLERALHRKKFSLSVPFVVAAMVCSSVYMSYMSLIMAGCYLLWRLLLADGPRRKRIRQFFLHCASIVLGIGIGCFIFLPMAYYLMTGSSRLSSGGSLLERLADYCSLFGSDFYKTAFLRFFSTTSQGIMEYTGYSNFYEAPVLFFSGLFVILALQYLFTIHSQDTSRKAKVLQYLAVAFFVFCMFVRLGAAAFNAFAYPFSRHSFIFMPLFAVMTSYVLDRILIQKKLNLPALALAALASVAACILSWNDLTGASLKFHDLLTCFLILFMAALLFAAARLTLKVRSAGTVIAAVLMTCVAVNVSLEGYLCYNERNVLTTSDPEYWGGLYNPNVTEALRYLRETDPTLFRAEKDYYSGSFCMDGMAQGYRGISAYNSTPNSNLEEFVNLVIPNFPIMAKYEYSYRQIGYYTGHSTLFGIKYLLAEEPDLQLDGFTLLKQFGDVYVYENTRVSSLARFYTSAGDSAVLKNAYGNLDLERMLLETVLLDLEPKSGKKDSGSDEELRTVSRDFVKEQTENKALSSSKLKKTYALEELPVTYESVEASGSSDSVEIELDRRILSDYERVYLEFDITTPEVSDITVNQDQPMEYHFRTEAGKTKHVQIAVPDSYDSMVLSRYNDLFEGSITNIRLLGSKIPAAAPSEADVTVEDRNKDSLITGTVQTEDSGFLFLPVPYENGWSASVDGEPVEILRADVGFMCIPVDAGEHRFTFTYRQPYLQQGVWISAGSLLIWAVIAWRRKMQNKTKRLP